MPRADTSQLARLSAGLSTLLDAGCSPEKIAAALLGLVPGALAAECQLDEATVRAGQPDAEGILVSVPLEAAGQHRGQLMVILPAKKAACQSLLSLAARLVAVQLPPTNDDQRHMMALVTIGEASGYLIHAMNNYLNSMVLQAACIEMETKPPVSTQAENIRREGAQAAGRLRHLQAVHPWPARRGERVDILSALRQVIRDDPDGESVEASLPDTEILLSTSAMGMKRLLTLLLRVARRCSVNKPHVRLSLRESGSVELAIEMPGCQCNSEKDGLHLPPEPEGGLHQIERDAARWLVNQSGGHLEVTQGPRGAILKVLWDVT